MNSRRMPARLAVAAAAELAGGDAGVRQIAVGKIAPSPDQPRKSFDDESIGELAASIRRHGVIQPLIIYRNTGEECDVYHFHLILSLAEEGGATQPSLFHHRLIVNRNGIVRIEKLEKSV